MPQVAKECVQELSIVKYPGQNSTHRTYNGPSCTSQYSSSFRDRSSSKQYNSQPHRDENSHEPNQGQRKMKCYYCEEEHHVKGHKNLPGTKPIQIKENGPHQEIQEQVQAGS